jgi:uncharacterized membrane protein YphA (DoxX/SURF4 family)
MADSSKKMYWAGWVVSIIPCLMLFMSSSMKLMQSKVAVDGMAQHGYPANTLIPIGIAELACTILFLIPRTRVFGALLLLGYLGGAVATHVRAGEPYFAPIAVGILVWLGLYLRDTRVRELVPLTS